MLFTINRSDDSVPALNNYNLALGFNNLSVKIHLLIWQIYNKAIALLEEHTA